MNTALVFADIGDDQLVAHTKSEDSALAKLLKDYTPYAQRIDRLPNVTDTLTGKALKAAIASMEPQDQIRLAYLYYQHKGVLVVSTEPEDVKEFRHLKIRVIKTLMYAFVALVVFGIGSVTTFMFKDHGSADTSRMVTGMFSTAAEIAKVLLSIGN